MNDDTGSNNNETNQEAHEDNEAPNQASVKSRHESNESEKPPEVADIPIDGETTNLNEEGNQVKGEVKESGVEGEEIVGLEAEASVENFLGEGALVQEKVDPWVEEKRVLPPSQYSESLYPITNPSNFEYSAPISNFDLKDYVEAASTTTTSQNLRRRLEQESDPYGDDEAEQRFLYSKPTCFIILGKPGVGKTELARRFADEWKCLLISALTIIEEEIAKESDTGKQMQVLLTSGEAIPEELVAKCFEAKVQSPEVAHHGYILDGLPSLCEDYMTISDQLALIKNWKLKPDFIINLKIPDEDLINRRVNQKIDPFTGIIYTKEVYNPEKIIQPRDPEGDEDADDKDEEDDDLGEEEMQEEEVPLIAPLSPEIVKRLVRRVEDEETHASQHIARYRQRALRLLEDYMADHDQQSLLELNANKPSSILIRELLTRLEMHVLRPAATVQRLTDPATQGDDEETPDDTIETDDLMRTVAARKMLAPRFRWRRSRWLRNCPVSLAEGNIVTGKAEFAVSFLDKMYFLADERCLSLFMANPRPYLVPPQPRPPCKVSVLGASLAGRTGLAHLIAIKYQATVLNIETLVAPRYEEERNKMLDKVREEATLTAIDQTIQALAEGAERERRRLEVIAEREVKKVKKTKKKKDGAAAILEEQLSAAPVAEQNEEDADEKSIIADIKVIPEKDLLDKDDKKKKKKKKQEGSDDAGPIPETNEDATDNEEELITEKPKEVDPRENEIMGIIVGEMTPDQMQEIPITSDHPTVVKLANVAVQNAASEKFPIADDLYIEVLEASIKAVETALLVNNPNGPSSGGWVLDNFPRTKVQWTLCAEKGIIPDDVVILKDISDEGSFLIRRWYDVNKTAIDLKIETRIQEELEEKRRIEELERIRLEEEKLAALAALKEMKELDLAERIANGEEVEDARREVYPELYLDENTNEEIENSGEEVGTKEGDEGEDEEGDKDNIEKEEQDAPVPEVEKPPVETSYSIPAITGTKLKEASEDVSDEEETVVDISPPQMPLPPEGVELIERQEKRKAEETELTESQNAATQAIGADPVVIEICQKNDFSQFTPITIENQLSQILNHMQQKYRYEAWELQGMDIDEDEEDAAAEKQVVVDDDDAVEEEEEDPNRSSRKPLGDTNYFCPVALSEKGILAPGNPEITAKYCDKYYYCSSYEARDKFIAAPDDYLLLDRPPTVPPPRLLLIGPCGAGKTLQGRHLADQIGVFHIQFRERLQEMIAPKMMRMQGAGHRKVGAEYTDDDELPVDEPLPEEEKYMEEDISESPSEVKVDGQVSQVNIVVDKPDSKTSGVTAAVAPIPEGEVTSTDEIDTEEEGNDKTGDEANLASGQEEEEDVQLNDEEEAISAYLKDEDSLPNDILDKVLLQFWNQEPFKSQGFILEGFPRTPDEVGYLAESSLFPDAVIVFAVDDPDVVARRFPDRIERWKKKRDIKLARRAALKERIEKKRNYIMDKRRKELIIESERKKEEYKLEKAERSDDEEDEEEPEEDDIEALLADEFEEEEEEEADEEDETYEEAADRIKNDIDELYDNDTNRISAIQEKFEELLVPRLQIEAGKKTHIVRYLLKKKIAPFVNNRKSIMERVIPITDQIATSMIKKGYRFLSRFGRWCPVKLCDGDCIQPMRSINHTSFPAIYRKFIYYLSSAEAMQRFSLDPLKYLQQASPKPVVPLRIAICGPPKCGKTTVAKRFEADYGCVKLSLGDALRQQLSTTGFFRKTHLSKCIREYLEKGLTVPDELGVKALEVSLMDVACQTRGYVLDGHPLTSNHVKLMCDMHILPVRIIELCCNSLELVNRATKDRYSSERTLPLHDSSKIFMTKLAAFQANISNVRNYYETEHSNWTKVMGDRSKWWMWNECERLAMIGVMQIQEYLMQLNQGKAASIANMCISPREFKGRLGCFEQYCPVSLQINDEFVDCSNKNSLKFAAEFRGHYYKMADEKCLQRFLKDAPRFVPPNCTKLLPLEAKMLPKRVTDDEAKNMFPKPIELRSYCPVTYLNGDQLYDSIVPGDRDFIVLYNEKLYCLQGEEQLELFMRKPMKYSNLVLPHKLPPAKEIIPLKQLPMLGFLEQSISKAIEKALVAVGSLKPKLPFASISSSALLYIALHLKANNPNNSEFSRTMYRNRLIQFEDTCQLISYLGDNMSKRYKQPIERPFDFDVKMQRFLVEKKKNNNYKKSQKITLRSIVNKQNMVGLPNGMVNRL